jgi:hypothetical protein
LKFLEIALAEATTQNGIGILGSCQYHERLVADVVSSSRLLRAVPDLFKLARSSPQVLPLKDQIGTVVRALRSKHEAANAEVDNKKKHTLLGARSASVAPR